MPRALGLGLLALAALLLALWVSGGGADVARLATTMQAQAQAQMAEALRALRAGQPGALAALWGLCFAYGVAHAVGPGHGKIVLGAYGAARAVSMARISVIAFAAALAQGASAIGLVLVGVALLGLARDNVTGLAEGVLDRAGLWAILALGLWLIWRGLRSVMARAPVHDHTHSHDGTPCATCGHSHGPSPAQLVTTTGWRETAALIGVIALRPCTGALFLLILTWRMGLVWQGFGGVIAMALGTGLVTAGVAVLAVGARQGAIGGLGRLGPVAALLELGAGGAIVLVSLSALGVI
jgi:ABC-type nickel/cobalt efflux system permease component RcnA